MRRNRGIVALEADETRGRIRKYMLAEILADGRASHR